ncbi:MAG: hypothetical protein GX047_09425 [Firmicutes bacterium]|nr:hypothetical protein [Bacillota bacterium]
MRRLITVLLILGLISGIGVGAQRLLLERDFRTVELAVDLSDLLGGSGIERLPDVLERIEPWGVDSIVLTAEPTQGSAQGWTPQELREMAAAVKDKGYRVLLKVGSGRELNNVQDSVKDRRRAGVASYPESFSVEEIAALVSLVDPEVIMFGGDEVAGYPHGLDKMASLLEITGVRFGLQEFAGQLGEAELAQSAPLHVVRVHTIYPKELSRYDVESGAARFLRAVKERSYRLLYVRFWPDDPETGARLIEELGTSLAALGYARGAAPTLPPWQSHWVYLVTALAAWAGAGLWLGLVLERSLGSWWKLLYRLAAAAAVLGVLALYFFFDQILARQALAFLTAVTFPVLAVIPQRWQTRGLQQGAASRGETVFCRAMSDHRISRGKAVGWSLLQFVGSIGLIAIGAAVMVATLGDFRFMLKIAEFRGVKAMSILPVLLAAVGAISFARNLGKPIGLRERWREMPVWAKGVLAAAVLGVVVIYIGRTGNFIIPVPEVEMRVREFLEQTFPYRPRTKELLIGHPLLILGFGLYVWGDERLGLACVVPGTIGQISLLNTFAHIHSPLAASISRSFWGLILGACLGSVLLYIALLVLKRRSGD